VSQLAENSSEKPEQRLKRFKLLALKARESAGKATSAVDRDEFLKIAHDWETMAKALERDVRDSKRP
jgi:hypothetical protein